MNGARDVQQVVLRVARCSDRSDIAGLVENFAEGAVLEAGGRTVEGRQAVFEFFGGSATAPADRERTKHVVTNTLVDADGEALVATSYWQVLRSWASPIGAATSTDSSPMVMDGGSATGPCWWTATSSGRRREEYRSRRVSRVVLES
jgi:hypothetical protein